MLHDVGLDRDGLGQAARPGQGRRQRRAGAWRDVGGPRGASCFAAPSVRFGRHRRGPRGRPVRRCSARQDRTTRPGKPAPRSTPRVGSPRRPAGERTFGTRGPSPYLWRPRRRGPDPRPGRPRRAAAPPHRAGLGLRGRERRPPPHGGRGRPGPAGDLPRHRQALPGDAGLPRPAGAPARPHRHPQRLPGQGGALVRHDRHGRLFEDDPDLCCHIRKTEPLAEELDGFAAWITGRKRFQGGLGPASRRSSPSPAPAGSSSTRSRPGTRRGSRPTGSGTTSRPTPSWRAATARSAAPPAPARPATARTPAPGAGSASTRPSAASTCPRPTETTYEPRQPRAEPARGRALRPRRAQGPGHHPGPRLGRAARLARRLPGRHRRPRGPARRAAGAAARRGAAAHPLRHQVRQRGGAGGEARHHRAPAGLQGDAEGRRRQQPGRGRGRQEPAAARRHLGRGRAPLARGRLLPRPDGRGRPALREGALLGAGPGRPRLRQLLQHRPRDRRPHRGARRHAGGRAGRVRRRLRQARRRVGRDGPPGAQAGRARGRRGRDHPPRLRPPGGRRARVVARDPVRGRGPGLASTSTARARTRPPSTSASRSRAPASASSRATR